MVAVLSSAARIAGRESVRGKGGREWRWREAGRG